VDELGIIEPVKKGMRFSDECQAAKEDKKKKST